MGVGLGPARNFTELKVWKKAHAFVLAVYRYSSSFPKTETYGLVAQFRRAAIGYGENEDMIKDLDEVSRMLNAYVKAIFPPVS
jgi:hypothetical protein